MSELSQDTQLQDVPDTAKLGEIVSAGGGGGGGGASLDPTMPTTIPTEDGRGLTKRGIWGVIWGALSALPSGFTSLYDWCVAQFGKKVDAQIIPAGAYTFNNGKSGFQAWAWRENGNWKTYAINVPSYLGNIEITDNENEPVRFTNDFVYLSGSDDSYSWNADSGAISFFDGYPNTIVTNADIPIQDFIANLTTAAARAKIAEAMPAPIDPSTATVSGKAADALAVKNALAGKANTSDLNAKLDKSGGTLTGELHIDGQSGNHRVLRIGELFSSPGALYITPYGIAYGRTEYTQPSGETDVEIAWEDIVKLVPAYSTTTSYAVGDICSYNGAIYQCVAATSGAWDASKWAERKLADFFSNSNSLGNSWIDGRIADGVSPETITGGTKIATIGGKPIFAPQGGGGDTTFCLKYDPENDVLYYDDGEPETSNQGE